jgi:two-component system, NtrC family, nitrogen regulation response regulator NtrX
VSDRILVVDDEQNIRWSLGLVLGDAGFDVVCAEDGEEALAAVEAEPPHAVFLDIELPKLDGMEVLRRLRAQRPDISVVMITGHATIERAIAATRLGAFDFVEKPFSSDRILLLARNAAKEARTRRELARKRAADVQDLLGESAPMKALREAIVSIGPSDMRVLIFGESGTGKELVAQALHRLSSRAEQPFVGVNCAAIPEELIESSLFGAIKGAFTGAVSTREGFFGEADGGTLFLDEIGDMGLAAQAKLLRVLQEGEYERVGSARATKVDVRVLAATHRDLTAQVAAGRFRDDLLYRLNVIPLTVPPLREREGDVRLLGEHFLADGAARRKLPAPTLPEASWRLLEAHAWPGNVRELKNVMERLVILKPGVNVRPGDLPIGMAPGMPDASGPPPVAGGNPYLGLNFREARDALERDLIQAAMERHEGNVTQAATELGLDRSYLHRRISALRRDGE